MTQQREFSSYFSVISSSIPLCSKSSHYMISILLNSLRCVLWLRMQSALMNILCVLEKNVYAAVVGESGYRCQLYPVDCPY